MAKLDLINVSVSYKGKRKKDPGITVINNLNCTFDDEKISVILGPSGCGKTTLLKTIIGLLPFEGTINCDDENFEDIYIKDKNISYVSQKYVLYPRLTVFDNIAFPLKNQKVSREEIIDRVTNIARKLNLIPCLFRKPKYLSGGQQQRVALAKALVKHPFLIFMDEPLSNVDPLIRKDELKYIKDMVKETRATLLYVTHNVEEAMSIGDVIFVMGEGKMIFKGTPKQFMNSKIAKDEGYLS